MAKTNIKIFFKELKEAGSFYRLFFLLPALILSGLLIWFIWDNGVFVADNLNKAFDFDISEEVSTPVQFDREGFERLNIE